MSNGELTPERDRMRGRRPFRSGRVALLALLAAATLALPATPAEAQAGVPRQVDTRVAAFEQAGLKALSAGRFESAASAFRDALALEPRNPRLHLGVAAVMYAQRRDGDARESLDRALALDPKLPEARELLGRVLYRAGDLGGAVLVFDMLVQEGRGGAALVDTLTRWRREMDLRERMHLTVGSGFTVAFEGPDDAELAARALASIERAAARIGGLLSHYPAAPIPVVLYTTEQFRDITRAPAWAGGAFDGTIRVPMRGALANPRELDRVVAHEYTHALVLDLAKGAVPAWLNEGLAVALEREDPSASGLAAAAEPTSLRAADAASGATGISLQALRASFGRFSGADAERAYAASGAAVRRLLDEAGGFAMTNLLRDLGEGIAFDEAFAHRMQRSVADFEASVSRR